MAKKTDNFIPSSVPGIVRVASSGSKREYVRVDTGEVISKRQYDKVRRGGISNESYAKARSEIAKTGVRVPDMKPGTRVKPTTPAQTPRYVTVETPLEKLSKHLQDLRNGKLSNKQAGKRIKDWFDEYGTMYEDFDFESLYDSIAG